MAVNFKQLAEQYRSTLFSDVIPFWLNNSPDREHGGYLTSLDRDGKEIGRASCRERVFRAV